MVTKILVNIGSGNNLLPDGTKPSLELMFTNHQWHSPQGNFTGYTQESYPWYKFENYQLKIMTESPRGQWVNSIYVSFSCIIIGSGDGLLPVWCQAITWTDDYLF